MAAEVRANKLNDRVMRYIGCIQSDDPKQVEHALDKLERIDMNLDILVKTKCGRVVNKLVDDAEVGERARSLVKRWRMIADEESASARKEASSTENRLSLMSSAMGVDDVKPSKLARVTHKDEEISKNSKSRFIKNEPFNDFEERPLIAVDKSPRKYQTKIVEPEALNDFEAQLLQADSHLIPRKKKRHGRTRDHILDPEDIQRTLEITTKTLKPIASIHHVGIRQPNPSSSSANPILESNNKSFDPTIFKRKTFEKVYAGRPKSSGLTEVRTLTEICQRYLMDHIDLIDELGDVPYSLLACVFERCTTEQLDRITSKNPQFREELNPLWERHVKKIFPTTKNPIDGEDWYQCYKRQCSERDDRLKAISDKIKQKTVQSAANEPILRTQYSELINPMKMQKKQIRNGLYPTRTAPDAQALSHARREIFNTGSKSALLSLPGGVASKGSVLASNGQSSKAPVSKKGALMAKTLKMFNSRRK